MSKRRSKPTDRAGTPLIVTATTILCLGPLAGSAAAQHEHHHEMQDAADQMDHGMEMSMAGPLGLDHSRWASGTAWQPDTSPVAAIHVMAGDWMLMFHWNVLAGSTSRGATAAASSSPAPTG